MHRQTIRLTRFAALLTLATIAAAGCEQIEVTTAPVERIEVSPPEAAIQVNGTTRFTAALLSSNGARVSGVPVAWSSLDPDIVEVDDDGLVRGLAPGTGRIQASSGGASAIATVTVTAPPPPQPPASPPATPTNVTAAAVASTAIAVAWLPPGGQTHYLVRVRRGTSGQWDSPVEVDGLAVSYVATNLQRSRTYQFQVAACNGAGCSAYSSPVTAST